LGKRELLLYSQQRIEDKTNEITAIPLIPDPLDVSDAVVSIDVIGTQTKIASQIRKQKGHYFLSVKGDQNNLLEDIEYAFMSNAGLDNFEELNYGHGRIETRKCSIISPRLFTGRELPGMERY